MQRALVTHPTSIDVPPGRKPYIDELGDGNTGLMVPPGCALHYALHGGEQHVSCAFGMMPRRYVYGPVGGLRVIVTLAGADGCPRVVYERVLDPMASVDDREAQDLELALPAHTAADLCLRMMPTGAAIRSGWGYWTRLTVE